MLNTNLPLLKRNIYHPAIGCSCGLHTWPTLLQSVCKKIYSNKNTIFFLYSSMHSIVKEMKSIYGPIIAI